MNQKYRSREPNSTEDEIHAYAKASRKPHSMSNAESKKPKGSCVGNTPKTIMKKQHQTESATPTRSHNRRIEHG